jgi:FkbM family methyltransferase
MLDLYRARASEKEPETVNWIENYMKPGQVFFDVGANIGAYSLIANAHLKGNLTVHAFEPSYSNYYQLCRNIILNGFQASITPHMIGLTENTEMLTFHYQSLDAGSAGHRFGAQTPNASSAQYVYSQPLIGFSMDYLIKKFGIPVPNHIKLDVDGTEFEVLSGAEKTLQRKDVKSILVEVRSKDGISTKVKEILSSKGFHLISKTDRGDGVTWNCIYARHIIE